MYLKPPCDHDPPFSYGPDAHCQLRLKKKYQVNTHGTKEFNQLNS